MRVDGRWLMSIFQFHFGLVSFVSSHIPCCILGEAKSFKSVQWVASFASQH
jgi:hypothetical protein